METSIGESAASGISLFDQAMILVISLLAIWLAICQIKTMSQGACCFNA